MTTSRQKEKGQRLRMSPLRKYNRTWNLLKLYWKNIKEGHVPHMFDAYLCEESLEHISASALSCWTL